MSVRTERGQATFLWKGLRCLGLSAQGVTDIRFPGSRALSSSLPSPLLYICFVSKVTVLQVRSPAPASVPAWTGIRRQAYVRDRWLCWVFQKQENCHEVSETLHHEIL